MATSQKKKSVGGSAAVSFRDEKLRQTSVERTGAPVQRRRGPLDSRNKEGEQPPLLPLQPLVGSLRAAGDCSFNKRRNPTDQRSGRGGLRTPHSCLT